MTTRFGNKVYPHSDQMDTNTAEIILAAQFTPWFTSYQHFADKLFSITQDTQ